MVLPEKLGKPQILSSFSSFALFKRLDIGASLIFGLIHISRVDTQGWTRMENKHLLLRGQHRQTDGIQVRPWDTSQMTSVSFRL